jgi:cytoskeletal protein RodZ
VSIGETLADARHQAGLSVTQVSQQTRIRESIIRDIEQGDFTACGGDFYARGHIRSIAGAVGTDPVPLISEYDADHGSVGPMRAAEVFQPSRPIKIRERRSPSLGLIVVVVLLAIIGYSVYHLVSSHDSGSPHASGTPTVLPPSTHPASTPTARPSPTTTPTLSDLVIKVAAGPEDCWVLLTRASDGSQIYMGVVSAGTSMTWTEKHAVHMVLGNPPAVVLTVNGQKQNTNVNNVLDLSFSPPSSTGSGSQAGLSSGQLDWNALVAAHGPASDRCRVGSRCVFTFGVRAARRGRVADGQPGHAGLRAQRG